MLQIYRELPEMVRRDFDYDVTVHQGDESGKLAVYNHTMEFVVYGRSVGGDTNRRFAMFAFNGGGVRVDIKVKKNFHCYMVMPSAKNFRSDFKEGVISVYLDKPDYFCIRLDDDDNSIISVFADDIMNPLHIPDANDPDVIVIDGVCSPENGFYDLFEDNKTLYITPGSVLNARVLIKGNNCKVYGRGAAVVDPYENIYRLSIIQGGTEGSGRMLFSIAGSGCMVDGITLIDARCFNYTITADNVVLKNAKAMSTMMTTDGVSVYNGSGALVDHCFLYVADNAMVFSAKNTHYRDITIGNTCTAVFPQVTVLDTLLEDIHIFRSNDGIINNIYNGRAPIDRVVRWKIDRMDTVDCTYARYFFQAGNMGVIDDKHVILNNISTGGFTGNGAPHKYLKASTFLRLVNWPHKLYTSNYRVDFHNVYVDGHPVTELEEGKYVIEGADTKATVNITNDGAYTPVKRNEIAVNYAAPDKIFVGKRQITFQYNPVWQDDVLYISAEEILSAMGKKCDVETTEIDGVKYTTLDALVAAGAATWAGKVRDYYLIKPTYNGENLLKEDSGEVSHWSEAVCYCVELVTEHENGEMYYSCQGLRGESAGMCRFITDEIKMHGAGKYTVSFELRGEPGTLKFVQASDTWFYADSRKENFEVTPEWKEYSFDIEIDEDSLRDEAMSFSVSCEKEVIKRFDAKNFKLIKNQ